MRYLYVAVLLVVATTAVADSESHSNSCGGEACDAVIRGFFAFFDRKLPGLGANGRACADCHMVADHFQLSPANAEARFQLLQKRRQWSPKADDPLFRPIDADDFRVQGQRAHDFSNLRQNGLIRIEFGLPANLKLIDPATNAPSAETVVDLWRMVPSVNDVKLTGPDGSNLWPREPHRGGGYQLLSYLYGAAEPYGFMLLDRSGLPRLLPVELDRNLDRMEEFLARAERVLDHVEAGTLPDYLLDDSAECRRCAWFGHTCNPPFGANAAQVLTDPELEADLERREALKDAAREFEALDRDVKNRLRGVESGIAGAFAIHGAWGKSSRIELPEDLKKQYTVTNPKGRFTLDITRV